MLPRDLKPDQFSPYPPQARTLVVAHLALLRQLPLSFVPSLLRESIDYDLKFPAEQSAISRELETLSSLSPEQLHDWFQDFARLSLSDKFEQFDWVNRPAQFVEQLSAYLWSTHQLDAFRKAATAYGDRLAAATPAQAPPLRRLGISIIGQGVDSYSSPLFRQLRQHGVYFNQVQSADGVATILKLAGQRAEAHPIPYGHWYIDGGQPSDHSPSLTCVSYKGMEPVSAALLRDMRAQIQRPGMGPEQLSTHLARLTPADLGMSKSGDPVLQHYQLKVLTEGSGTQIFSTIFAQWAAREALRRAQPVTMVVRFAPRQRQRPMNELLSAENSEVQLDPLGSLVDADMGSWYNWINQQRLPGAETSAFLAWFEGHSQAVLISPSMPRSTTSSTPIDLNKLFALASA